MINGKEDKNLVVALDVGTSKIVVIVAEIQVRDAIINTQHRCKVRGAKIGHYVVRKIQDAKSRVL